MAFKYNFEIRTGDQLYAGTDSNIFVTLVGERGTTAEMRLNVYIKGNAFERNQIDRFSVPFGEDVGDIYKILLRSDCMYPGSDWLLNYIHVRGVISTAKGRYRPFTKFKYAKWVKDKKTKTLDDVSGYRHESNIGNIVYKPFLGAVQYLTNPTSQTSKQQLNIKQEKSVTYTLNTKAAASVETKASVSGDVKAYKAALDVMLKAQIEQETGKTWTETMTIDRMIEMQVDPHTKNYPLREVWSLGHLPMGPILGDTSFDGSDQTQDLRFSGLYDEAKDEWAYKADDAVTFDLPAGLRQPEPAS